MIGIPQNRKVTISWNGTATAPTTVSFRRRQALQTNKKSQKKQNMQILIPSNSKTGIHSISRLSYIKIPSFFAEVLATGNHVSFAPW